MEGVFFFFCKLGPHLIKHVGEGLMVVIIVLRIERIHGAIVRGGEGDAFEAHPFCEQSRRVGNREGWGCPALRASVRRWRTNHDADC